MVDCLIERAEIFSGGRIQITFRSGHLPALHEQLQMRPNRFQHGFFQFFGLDIFLAASEGAVFFIVGAVVSETAVRLKKPFWKK